MSSQKGNATKKRPPKYQNKASFKNNMHDCSKKTKALNSMTVGGVCDKCRETIQWKIKYKKYKPLTLAKKCIKCSQKTVKYAYHVICSSCSQEDGVCAKCGTKGNSINPHALTPTEQATEDGKLEADLKFLSERKRRAFFRWQDKGSANDSRAKSAKVAKLFEEKEEQEDSDADEDSDEKQNNSEDEKLCKFNNKDSDMEEDLVNVVENGLDLDIRDKENGEFTSQISDHKLFVHFDDALQFVEGPCQDSRKTDKPDVKEELLEDEIKVADANLLKDGSIDEIS